MRVSPAAGSGILAGDPMPGFSSRELADLSALMASAVERGLEPGPALELYAEERRSAPLLVAAAAIRDGAPLPDALAPHVPSDYVAVVRAGLEGGRLGALLRHAETYYALRARVRRGFQRIAIYLSFALTLSALVLGAVGLAARQFREIYESVRVPLPPLTMCVMWAVERIWVLAGIAGGATVLALAAFRLIRRGLVVGRLGYFLPVWGGLQRSRDLALFGTVTAIRLQAGAPVPEALEAAARTLPNRYLSGRVRAAKRRVEEGEPLSSALFYETFFPRMLAWAVSLAEGRRDLARTFDSFARTYSADLDRGCEVVVQLLTPAGILFVGNLAFFSIFSLFLPLVMLLEGISTRKR